MVRPKWGIQKGATTARWHRDNMAVVAAGGWRFADEAHRHSMCVVVYCGLIAAPRVDRWRVSDNRSVSRAGISDRDRLGEEGRSDRVDRIRARPAERLHSHGS